MSDDWGRSLRGRGSGRYCPPGAHFVPGLVPALQASNSPSPSSTCLQRTKVRSSPCNSKGSSYLFPRKTGGSGEAGSPVRAWPVPLAVAPGTCPHPGVGVVGQGGRHGVCIPDCGVKLKGKDDVMVVADLANEAALGAQVTVVDVLGGKLDQGLEEAFVHPIRDLWRASAGRQAF